MTLRLAREQSLLLDIVEPFSGPRARQVHGDGVATNQGVGSNPAGRAKISMACRDASRFFCSVRAMQVRCYRQSVRAVGAMPGRGNLRRCVAVLGLRPIRLPFRRDCLWSRNCHGTNVCRARFDPLHVCERVWQIIDFAAAKEGSGRKLKHHHHISASEFRSRKIG